MATRVVLNLKEMRGRASDAPVIVDFDGKKHAITGLPIDGYLALIGVQDRYNTIAAGETRAVDELVDMIAEIKSLIASAIPGFPVGGLLLEELMMVVQAIQGAVVGEESGTDGGAGGEAAPGESTSPS